MNNIKYFVEVYDTDTDMVWSDFDTMPEAKQEMKVWNLDKLGYSIRWVACEVKGGEYWTLAHAGTLGEVKNRVKQLTKLSRL